MRTDVLTPHSAFIKEWSRKERCLGNTATESTVAYLFEFKNARSAKKLELFAWTVEQWHALHFAFLQQVVDA